VGSVLSRSVPPQTLLLAFALLMIAAGAAMLLRREYQPLGKPSIARVVSAGFVVGLLTGVLGIGGGFLIVPALVLFANLSMGSAVGTSVAVIAVNCAGGLMGRLWTPGAVHWALTLGFSAVAIAGSFAGAAMVGRVPVVWLRRAFAVFVLALAGYMIAANLPA
jgi:uncharacterized membrane protein YfcA